VALDLTSFRWQYLDINDDYLTEIRERCLLALPNNKIHFQQFDVSIKEFLGMEVNNVVIVQIPPRFMQEIHADFRPDNNVLAINFPLINCQDAVTEMWESNESTLLTERLGYPTNLARRGACKKIDQFIVDRPVIFNTKILHSVRNNSRNTRIAVSLRFKNDPWHLIDQQPDQMTDKTL